MKSLKWPESPNNLFFAISGKEEACLLMKGAGIMLLLDYCFYQSLTAFFLLLPAGYWFYRSEKRQLISKKRQEARCCPLRLRARRRDILWKMHF